MQQLGQYQLLAPQPLAATLQEQAGAWFGVPGERQLPPFLFCGEISVTARQALRAQMQEGAFFVSNLQSARRASWLAQLALQRLREGQQDDPLALEPLYLRRPSITTSTRKRPLLEGTSQRSTAHSTTEREEGALRH
jgi:tRNA threonylcarbamoyladenosine biosynthesis protein TsaB